MLMRGLGAAVILTLGLMSLAGQAAAQSLRTGGTSFPPPVRAPESQRIRLEKSALSGDLVVSLREAIELALEGNPILMVEKVRLEQTREQIEQQRGEYDPVLRFTETASRQDNVVASRFFPTGVYLDQQQSLNLGIEGRTYTGGTVSLGMDYSRLESTSNVQTLSPQFTSNLTLGFSHPLLRDFGRGTATTAIRVAEKQGEIAEQNLFVTVSQLVQQVEEIYWNLVFQRQDLEGKRRSLEVARELLVQNQELFQAGRVANMSVLQASAGVAERVEDVITAESEVERLEDRLKTLLWLDLSTTDLTPTQLPVDEMVNLDERESVDTAFRLRPEIQSLETEREQREIELRFATNQTRPRLDVAGQVSLTGMSGRPNSTCLDPTSPICVPVGSGIGDTIFADRTSSLDSVKSLFSRKPFEGWSVELRFEVPLGNRTAESREAEARLRLLETDARLRALHDQIEEEIRNAIRETLTAEERIAAARETIAFLEDQLEGMQSQLQAGLASSYEVLQVLDELDVARTTELRAIADLNVGLSRVRLADASGLSTYDIELERPPRYDFADGVSNR